MNGHNPNPEQFLGDNSVTIYIRQDPFRETIYISYSSLLTQLGQLAGVVILLYFIGFMLTAFWAYRFYNVSLIKQLYTVKHTSAGREFELPSPRNANQINPLVNPASDSLPLKSDAEKVSKLWEKIDYVRWKRLRANILSWQQIDKADIKNILSSLVNRKKLSLNTR